jgi:hypothetical protein
MGPSGGSHALDGRRGGLAHLAVAVGFELVCVERDAIVFVGFEPQDLGCNVFQRVQQLAIARGEQSRVRAGELDVERARPIPGHPLRRRSRSLGGLRAARISLPDTSRLHAKAQAQPAAGREGL